MRKGFSLGIISDAWPSLERKYRLLDLRKYFKTFVISAQVGCCKPDRKDFRKGDCGNETAARKTTVCG